MNQGRQTNGPEDVEIELLLAGIFRYYGYDFRDYTQQMIKARIRERMLAERVSTISRFQDKILHEPRCLQRFLRSLSSTGAGLFGDADYYRAFRSKLVPMLKTYPFVRIWHVACSTGEETYGLAIMLTEEGIYSRCRIYATDMSDDALTEARKGVMVAAPGTDYSQNYVRAGGRGSLADYCKFKDKRILFDSPLKRNIVFSQHNVMTDGSFNEFQVIVCRNAISHFTLALQARVHSLFFDSLSRFGVLVLGPSDSLQALPQEKLYNEMNTAMGFYQKVNHLCVSNGN